MKSTEDFIRDVISDAKLQTYQIIKSKTSNKRIVGRYTAAMAVNFTDWIGKTFPWARHEVARYTLVDNLRCETSEDHVGMLLRFAELSKALPGKRDYAHVREDVRVIRNLLQSPTLAGLSGTALCAILENTSLVFIPDLARRAKSLGCTDFTYTDVHGEADQEHSDAFIKALIAESSMGYYIPRKTISAVARATVSLLERIYD